MSEMLVCPKCQQRGGTWPYRAITHSQELGLECPSCGSVLTETFLRDALGVTLPPRTITWRDVPPTPETPATHEG